MVQQADVTMRVIGPLGPVAVRPLRVLGISLVCRCGDGKERVFGRQCAADSKEFDATFLSMGGSYEGLRWEDGTKYIKDIAPNDDAA